MDKTVRSSNCIIHITSCERFNELRITLVDLREKNPEIPIVVIDDNSYSVSQAEALKNNFSIEVIQNQTKKGVLRNRNDLLNNYFPSRFSINLDDDANFITPNFTDLIEEYFNKYPEVGLLAFNIFWSENYFNDIPKSCANISYVKGFVGCGCAWRKEAWELIPDYPIWYGFYGEEDFASLHLFINGKKTLFTPDIVVHHRVNLKHRRLKEDNFRRRYMSLRTGWYNIFMFYPMDKAFCYFFSSIKHQLFKVKNKDFSVILSVIIALYGLIINIGKIFKQRTPMNNFQLEEYNAFKNTVIYGEI